MDEHPNATQKELMRALGIGYNRAALGKQRWFKERKAQTAQAISAAEAETDTNPTEGEKEAPKQEPKPIGRGVFGDIYDQFKGRVKEAFDFLIRHKSGDLLGVFHRDDIGDIDLVWGDKNDNRGLEHIIDKHVGEGKDFATIEEAMQVIDEVINNGQKIKEKWDKVTFDLNGRRVVVSKNVRDEGGNVIDESKNWVVTSFDNNIPKSQKKSPTPTRVTPESDEGGRAVTSGDSVGKDTKNISNNKKTGEKKSDRGDGKPTWDEHVNKAMEAYDKAYSEIEKNDGERLRKEAAGYSDERLLNTYIRNAGISQIFGKGREGMRKFVSEEKNFKAEKLDDVKANHLEAAPDAARQSFVQDVLRAELDRRGIEYKEDYTFAETSEAEKWYKQNVEGKAAENLLEEMAAVDERERSLAGKPGYKEAYDAKAALADRIAEVVGELPTKDLLHIHKEAKKRGMHSIMAHVEGELLRRRDGKKKQKAENAKPVTKRERRLRDALVGLLRKKAGIDVVTESEEGQRVLEMANGRERLHKVYHGSGADFEAFDHSHMGEGEGAQAFGWGTYVTEVEGIGRRYAKKNIAEKYRENRTINRLAEDSIADNNGDIQAALKNWKNVLNADWIDKKLVKKVIKILETGKKLPEGKSFLYTVEIPEDNGSNYIDWTKKPGIRIIRRLVEKMNDKQKERISRIPVQKKQDGEEIIDKNDIAERILWHVNNSGWNNLYDVAEIANGGKYVGNEKSTAMLLHSAGFVGIKYPAEYYSGGREDGAKNYVIFDEGDLQITDKVKFFRTEDGEAYGFTMGGKIYLDPRFATAETPIHEYTHLWAEALRQANPKAWERLKSELAKDTELMKYVRRLYPELDNGQDAHTPQNGQDARTPSDELMEEVFAHYSGRRGAERLREEQRQAMEGVNDYVEKAGVVAMFERLRDAMRRFWSMARDLFAGKSEGVESMSAEDFADMALADLLGGYNPTTTGVEVSDKIKAQRLLDGVTKAANTIKKWIESDATGKSFTIELPQKTKRMIRRAMGRDFDSHNITSDGIRHALGRHGVGGEKITESSIPIRKEDAELIPYIMTAPDYVRRGSTDNTGRESIRFYKTLSNGYVVVVEKEYKNSPDDMETINMWAEKSSRVADARSSERPLRSTSTPANVAQNDAEKAQDEADAVTVITRTDAAKIRKDSETAIKNDKNISYQREIADSEADSGEQSRSKEEDVLYRIREDEAPTKTGIGNKVFVLKDGKLYPPMVANPDGADTPVGVWLNADAAPVVGTTKTGRQQVKAGGKGTQGGSGQLAYRPGWHLGEIPYALQFNRKDAEGNKTLFPANFVWAEVEYAKMNARQEETARRKFEETAEKLHLSADKNSQVHATKLVSFFCQKDCTGLCQHSNSRRSSGRTYPCLSAGKSGRGALAPRPHYFRNISLFSLHHETGCASAARRGVLQQVHTLGQRTHVNSGLGG